MGIFRTRTAQVFGVLIILVMGYAASAHAEPKLGLASAWLFDENGGDIVKDVVSGHHGEIKGSLKWTAKGKFGSALEFPGEGDSYVRVDHADVFNADPYTFVAWVELQPTSWQYVVWRNGEEWPEAELVRHLDIWIHQAHYPVFMWHVNGVVGRIEAKTVIADGDWHHIAKVYDGEKVQMFIDGELEDEAPSGGALDTSVSPIWIGARPGDVAATGLFDEVGFFTEALSEADINAVMADGLAVYADVAAAGKLATTWAWLKR